MSSSINSLTTNNTVTAATKWAVSVNGVDMSVTTTVLATYLETVLPGQGVKVTQHNSPSATAFSVPITDSSISVWLVLTPTATFATGTIVLPSSTVAIDKQEVLVNCTQIVTALTVDGNGSTVTGAPTALTANDFFLLRYDKVVSTWYRVG